MFKGHKEQDATHSKNNREEKPMENISSSKTNGISARRHTGLSYKGLNDSAPLSKFMSYLVPSMLTMMLMAVYTFTDTFVVGQRLGSVALGAMGICTPVLNITYAFGFLFGMGGASTYAILMGQGRKKEANRIFSTSVAGTLFFGIAAAVILNIFARPLAYFLGASDSNIVYTMQYLRVILIYIPGFMMDIVMMCFMKNEGHPNLAMVATTTGCLMNVVLDFLFVFGFGWGMFGAAFATAICSGIGCAINIINAYRKHMNIRIQPAGIRPALLTRICRNGLSVLVLESSSGIVTFVFIAQANRVYGADGASIYTIIMNWALICINLVMGVAQAAQPLLGEAYGRKDLDEVAKYRRYSLVGSFILGLVFLGAGYSLTRPLVSVFASDSADVISGAAFGLRLYLPAFLLMGVGICVGYYFQSLEYSWQSMLVMLLRGIILPCFLCVAMTLLFGKIGLWLSVPAAEGITAVISFVLLKKYRLK